jgi:hypothetical protein
MAEQGWTPQTEEPAGGVLVYRNDAGCFAFVVATQIEEDVEIQLSQQTAEPNCAGAGTADATVGASP